MSTREGLASTYGIEHSVCHRRLTNDYSESRKGLNKGISFSIL